MAYTDHPNGAFLTRPGNYNVAAKILDQEFTLIRYISSAVDNLTSGAYYKLWSVPAGFMLLETYVGCVAAEGAAETIDIVDDDSASVTFLDEANLNSIGAVTGKETGTAVDGFLYTSAGFIVMLPNAALTVTTFYVMVKGIITNTSM